MRALIITRSGSDVVNVINFLITIGCSDSDIVTVMDTKQSISNWWRWMTEDVKCFVYIDPCINELNFSSELFTPNQLRNMIFESPFGTTINIFISSNESFEMLWVYEPSPLYDNKKYIASKSHLHGETKADVIVITGKPKIYKQLSDIHGLCYIDIAEYYNLFISFSKSIELTHKYI